MNKSKTLVTLLGVAVAMLATLNTFGQEYKHYNLDDTKIALRGFSPVSYFEILTILKLK